MFFFFSSKSWYHYSLYFWFLLVQLFFSVVMCTVIFFSHGHGHSRDAQKGHMVPSLSGLFWREPRVYRAAALPQRAYRRGERGPPSSHGDASGARSVPRIRWLDENNLNKKYIYISIREIWSVKKSRWIYALKDDVIKLSLLEVLTHKLVLKFHVLS